MGERRSRSCQGRGGVRRDARRVTPVGHCVLALLGLGASLVHAQAGGASSGALSGSLALTSDYFVRGISRSNDRPALQLDLHYLNDGFIAGLFASNTQIDPGEPRDVELSPYLGYAWSTPSWQGRAQYSNYSYPWNAAGSGYNYDELEVAGTYRDWLDLRLTYSPDWPRYFPGRGLRGVDAESLTVTLQHALARRWSGHAGAGYVEIQGGDPRGYTFWGAGLSVDFEPAPVSVTLSVVGTSAEARTLFYNSAGGGHAAATVLWRF